jgi:branched-chain amino acid transport system permease protein
MTDIASILFDALSWAMATFLVAAGLTLIFGVLHILNFAHGSFFMVGAYLSYTAVTLLGGDISATAYILLAVAIAIVVAMFGLVVDFAVFRRLRGVDHAYVLIASYALLLVVNGLVKLVWGVDVLSVPPPHSLSDAIDVFGVTMPIYTLFTIVAGLAVFGLLECLMRATPFGRMVQAVGADPWTAGLLGINVVAIYTVAVFMGFGLAGLAGGILAANQSLSPTLGDLFVIQAFAVIIVGGMGSVTGAFLASLLLGLVNALGDVFIPDYPGILSFVALAICLLVKPRGLMVGGKAV